MRIDNKIRNYMNKNNTKIVKSYVAMCEIMHENVKKGEAKINQLEEWRLYFDFEQQGQKFIIKEIYDQKTIKENKKEHDESREANQINERSPYRKYLVPILLYLLQEGITNGFTIHRLELAVKCGFFNENMRWKRNYNKYIDYRDSKKYSLKDKKYFNVNISKSTYYELQRDIKDSVYEIIERTLIHMQKLGILNYEIVDVGIDTKDENGIRMELLEEEIEEYKGYETEARRSILEEYNKTHKIQKREIELKDFIYHPRLRNEYFKILKDLTKDAVWYDLVCKFFKIKLTTSYNIAYKTLDTINTREEYVETIKKLNAIYVGNLKKRTDDKIKKKESEYQNLRKSDDKFKNRNYARKEYNDKVKYYNKTEIIDQLISLEPIFDVIDLSEYEIPDYAIPKADVNKTASEIFDEFNIRI